MNSPLRDPVLLNDWHPVAKAADLAAGALLPASLLDTEIVLWRDSGGLLHAWEDRCPHRGMKLSMGRLEGDQLTCRYHGWRYGSDGRCLHIPALPELRADNMRACVASYAVQEAYGLVWVCLGTPDEALLRFPEFADPQLRKVWVGPFDVHSSGPRIVENFLDMAHFAFVHEGILGEQGHEAIRDYALEHFDDAEFGKGVRAVQCFAWQPRSNTLATSGSHVEYTYRVVRPLTAILTKEPAAQDGFREAISLHLQPVEETLTRVWIIMAMSNFEQSDEELREFQNTIFSQDTPIVENQRPLRLPLAPGAEISVACDRMSLAYRAYLRELGLHYGVINPA